MTSFNIVEPFFTAAERHADRMALIEGSQSLSYRELADQVRRTAAAFRRRGLTAGDRVLVFVPMSTDLYRVVLALFSLGAVAVFLDEWVSFERLELCCRLAKCRGFIAKGTLGLVAMLSREIRKIPLKLPMRTLDAKGAEVASVDPESPALITFTTGSTGTPKAALRSHRFLDAQFQALIPLVGTETDVSLTLLPIVLFLNLGLGKTSVIPGLKVRSAKRFQPHEMARIIARYGANTLIASPFFLRGLAALGSEALAGLPLKRLFSGGAPLFPGDAALVARALPAAAFTVVYGSTEAEPISHLDARRLADADWERGLPVGRPHERVEVRIVSAVDGPIAPADLDGLTLPENSVGEICVAGSHVLETYFENAEAQTRHKIFAAKTFHRTGDAGYLSGGELFLVGRVRQIFSDRRGTHYPFLVEGRLREVEGVAIGTCVELGGESVLVIELAPGASATVVSQALDQGPLGTMPVRFVPRIPRDPRHHSKIDYDALLAVLR